MGSLLIVNPRSGGGKTGRHFDSIVQAVRAAAGDVRHVFTERPMHAAEVTREALRGGCDLVVAAGGDGTINEVVNGFFEAPQPGEPPRPIRPGAALAVLPRGTGGDFRRSIGLDGDLLRNAARLKGARTKVDVGLVTCAGERGQPVVRYFLNVADVGVGAEVVGIANASSKALGGKLTFKLASLRALSGWRDRRVLVSFDGEAPQALDITTLAIANGRYFGGGMLVAPGASLDDGLFHVTVWSGYRLSDFVFKGRSMYDGSHVRLPGTSTRTARTVRVELRSGESAGVEVDGEGIGALPATFTVLPGALLLVR